MPKNNNKIPFYAKIKQMSFASLLMIALAAFAFVILGVYSYAVFYDPIVRISKSSPEILELKRKAANEFAEYSTAITTNNPNLHIYTAADYDYCADSPTFWGGHASDPAHCYLSTTKVFGFDGDFMQTMKHLDTYLSSQGWHAESSTMQEVLDSYSQSIGNPETHKKLISDLSRPHYSNGDTTLDLSWVERSTIDKSHFDIDNISTEPMGGFLNLSGSFENPSYNTFDVDDYDEYENYVKDYNQKRYLLVRDITTKYPYAIAISLDKTYATKQSN